MRDDEHACLCEEEGFYDEMPLPPDIVLEHRQGLQFGAQPEAVNRPLRSPFDLGPTPEMLARFYWSRDAQRRLRAAGTRATSRDGTPRARTSRRRARHVRRTVRVTSPEGDPPGPVRDLDVRVGEGCAP